ncbi:hypothetical protein [uncultured Corynebacterium sp.]|uniref:hypothetical protein n=1 Tax=uncultured Corynebacterium sp. TaxID=159447 RepID=UPI0025974A4D|nr:hypothetical protein [uncultured Corynebacterium sp.]
MTVRVLTSDGTRDFANILRTDIGPHGELTLTDTQGDPVTTFAAGYWLQYVEDI